MKKSLLTTFAVLFLGILAFAQSTGIQINPSFLSASLLQESDTTVTTQIFNNTAEEISFSFPGFTDRNNGGPDAYGYTWTDSDDAGYFYTWTEISETGTEITTLTDDNRVGPFAMGFDFPYYGESRNQFWISSNGAILFDDISLVFANGVIPTNNYYQTDFIAALWDDLNFNTDSSTAFYQVFPDKVIVQFEHAVQYGNTRWATFQVILMSNGAITLSYKAFSDDFNFPTNTIGLQSPVSEVGLQISYNEPYLHNELSIFINAGGEEADFITSIQPSSGTIPAFSAAEVVLTYSSAGYTPGRYNQTVTCTTSDPAFDTLNVYNLMVVSELPMFIGTVSDADSGNPLEGVNVTAGSFATTTGPQGNYELQVTPGTYTLSFEKQGYDIAVSGDYSVTYDDVVNVTQALTLSDEFIVGGTVFAGIYQLDLGYVNAFKTEGAQVIDIFADLIDTLGYYNFPVLTLGEYLIKAEPAFGSQYEGGYLPTYFGDVVHWADAQVIDLTYNIFNADINLVPATLANSDGPGTISGYIYHSGENKSGDALIPAADIPIVLKQDNKHAMVMSNSEGYFEFSRLDFGTYTMFAEMFGKEAEFRNITISQNNESSEANNLFIYAAEVLYGIGEQLPAGVKTISAPYPNPASTEVTVQLNLTAPATLRFELINTLGRVVTGFEHASTGGSIKITLPVSDTPGGIYSLRISDSNGRAISRKLVIR